MLNQAGKPLLFVILISALMVQSCASPSALSQPVPTSTSKPANPSRQTEEPEYDLYAGFTESKQIPFVILHPSGEKLGVTQDPGSSQNTGVVWISSDGKAIVIYTDENALPTMAVIGENIIQYSNHTGSMVDVTITYQDGSQESFQGKLDTDLLNKISKLTAFTAPSYIPVKYSITNSSRLQQQNMRLVMTKFGLYVVGFVTCLAAPAGAVRPDLLDEIASACAGTILEPIIVAGGLFIDMGWLEEINQNLNIAGCMGGLDASACASLAVAEEEKEKRVADETIQKFLTPPNPQLVPTPAPPTARPTALPTKTPPITPAIVPTPARPTATGSVLGVVSSLRGTVTQQSSCRYGPSQYHLYKTGFKPQAPVKIIGRDADGDWLQIELSGGNTPCWMNASLIQVEGDMMALPDAYPPERRLPISDAFPQIGLISASPGGIGITASWVHHEIREDLKQTDTVEYVIEVWTCVDGKPAFYAVGTNDTFASFQIDNSCGIASYAALIGQDEHGFSFPTKIPLP